MRSRFYDQVHEEFRAAVRPFLEKEVAPRVEEWEDARAVDRSAWTAAAEIGLLGFLIPEEYGGLGEPDYRFRCVVAEETARVNATSYALTLGLQDDLVSPYLVDLGSDEQKKRWLPGMAAGELIGALGLTEPGAGSDLQGISTRAVRDGSDWVLNGAKTFISSGIQADHVVVFARTDPDAGSRGFSLFVVERDMPGFERGRQLRKVGLDGQDTAELFFSDVRIPADNVLGEVGQGLPYLMQRLPRERMYIAMGALAAAEATLQQTLEYTAERTAFKSSISSFQHSRFELAEMETELDVARAYIERCVEALNEEDLTAVDAAKAKWWLTELQLRITTRCVQLFGGYGYMLEYPVGRAYRDARIQTIYGGTTEIMKEIIGRDQAARYRAK
ncbi:acyl-CoA dehydrogenase family protein [Nocardioides sp.]|uniref:acyl-CoA dehydrogenase family protein n=1 Tax=Nocardioides sp. TaxID=35761 RepID=UPI003512B086